MHHTVHTYPARGTLGIHVKEPAKRLRVSRRATGNPTHTGYGTCPYRLHQLRPTNQTHIRLARCTNRAGPLSTLLFFPFSLPLSLPLVLPLSRPPLLSPFSRISSSGSVCIVTLLFDRSTSLLLDARGDPGHDAAFLLASGESILAGPSNRGLLNREDSGKVGFSCRLRDSRWLEVAVLPSDNSTRDVGIFQSRILMTSWVFHQSVSIKSLMNTNFH